ncbi:hypothetical protein [Streptomyces sp. NPDC056056]|uniref:hypothetical protein n=1 Tax=Streptomyces sp. NPDC056056 TaxID=3345698 RepID=UPI0035D89674
MKRTCVALLTAAAIGTPAALAASARAEAPTTNSTGISAAIPASFTTGTLTTSQSATNEHLERGRAANSKAEGGVVLRLHDVPAQFHPGADWEEFELTLENTRTQPVSDFSGEIHVVTMSTDPALRPEHMGAQMLLDGQWTDLELWDMGGDGDVDIILPVEGMALQPGERIALRLRLRFTAAAPLVTFYLGPQVDDENAAEDDYWETSEIVRPGDPTPEPTGDPTPEPTGDPTPDPTGDPTPEPTGDPTPEPTGDPTPEPTGDPTPEPTGDPTPDPTAPSHGAAAEPSTGATPSSAASGSHGTDSAVALANTGSNSVTPWILSGGGLLVAGGSALAVAAQRARRRRVGETDR